jgi:hypothetical protein
MWANKKAAGRMQTALLPYRIFDGKPDHTDIAWQQERHFKDAIITSSYIGNPEFSR